MEKAEVLDSLTELMDNEDESDTGVVLTKSLAFKFFGKLGGNKVKAKRDMYIGECDMLKTS